MRYNIRHTTNYEYSEPVSLSHHVLHLEPRPLARQECIEYHIDIRPRPLISKSHLDYFGNLATFITLEGSHEALSITSNSTVETRNSRSPEPQETPAWESVRDLCRGEQMGNALDAADFIFDSALIRGSSQFSNYSLRSFSKGQPILESVLDLTERIHGDFTFDPQATTLTTPLEDVFRTKRGVCQDFAQFEIACLRSLGLPARYISGYLETDPPPGQARLLGADASHAWLSFFIPGIGWIDIDPTNNCIPSTRHITLAWGRDYNDVSPVRGVIVGNGEHQLTVAVDVLPIA
jgi:transglutaminase-like putative cysteine protease